MLVSELADQHYKPVLTSQPELCAEQGKLNYQGGDFSDLNLQTMVDQGEATTSPSAIFDHRLPQGVAASYIRSAQARP